MEASMHAPKVEQVQTYHSDREFHVIQLTDNNGKFDLFIKGDWSDWDEIVTSVEAYRFAHEALVSKP